MLNQREDAHVRRWLLPAAATGLLFAASTIVHAQDAAPAGNGLMKFPNVRVVSAPPQAAAAISPDPAAQSGFRAFIDPATGKLMEPTREAVEALAAQDRLLRSLRPTRTLPMVVLPSGSTGVLLDESFMSYSVARRADDGRLAMACVPGEEMALTWLGATAPALGLGVVGSGGKEESK